MATFPVMMAPHHEDLYYEIIESCKHSELPAWQILGILTLLVGKIESGLCPRLSHQEIADSVREMVLKNLQKSVS